MERDQNHRRRVDAGSRTSISEHATEDERVILYVVSERKECSDDIPAARKFEV